MAQQMEWPRWITPQLLNWMIDLCNRHPSRIAYLENAKEMRSWYRGDRFLAPVKGRDDVEIDDRNATSRRNIIGETVDELGSILLKNKPIIRRKPYLPWHVPLSDDIDSMWLWQWLECGGQGKMRSMMEDSQLTGLSNMKILWDPFVGYPGREGVIRLMPIPEGAILVDPYASNHQRGMDARFIIHHVRKLPEELIAKFGETAAKAMGYSRTPAPNVHDGFAQQMLNMSNIELTKPISGSRVPSAVNYPIPSALTLQADDTSVDPLEGAKRDVYECWIFPNIMYANDLLTGKEVKYGEYKYGVVATMVDNTIINVKPNPYFARRRLQVQDEYGQLQTRVMEVGPRRHPFVFLWWKRTADTYGNRSFYNCMSMVEWMTSIQFNYNAIRRNIAIIGRTISNPMIAYNEDLLAMDPAKIRNVPGQLIKVQGGATIDQAIRQLHPSGIPADLMALNMQDEQAIRQAGGIRPGLVGLFPDAGGTSHTPAATIGTLQEAAFGPLWRYVEEIGDTLVDVSSVMDGLMQQKYSPGNYMATSRNGREFWLQWTGEHTAAQFQRHVVSGATTPVYDLEKEQREAFVMQLAQEAIVSTDPRLVRIAMIYMRSLYNFPWAYQYEQELQQELMRLEQMTQGMQQIGASDLQNQWQGQLGQQGGQPTAGAGVDEEGLAILSQRMAQAA
jgi:hypothetical protein